MTFSKLNTIWILYIKSPIRDQLEYMTTALQNKCIGGPLLELSMQCSTKVFHYSNPSKEKPPNTQKIRYGHVFFIIENN